MITTNRSTCQFWHTETATHPSDCGAQLAELVKLAHEAGRKLFDLSQVLPPENKARHLTHAPGALVPVFAQIPKEANLAEKVMEDNRDEIGRNAAGAIGAAAGPVLVLLILFCEYKIIDYNLT